MYFLEVGARVLLKIATKIPLGFRKSPKNLTFLDYYSKAKMEEREKGNLCFYNYFRIYLPCSAS